MTAHIEAKLNEIATTVLMPGDPLRAKFIAETYLTDYKLVNKIRNIYAYTGYYKNKLVTVMASGIGMPSIGIYSYELYKYYGVENIIRIGTAGSYRKELNLYEILLTSNCYSDSSYAKVQNNSSNNTINASLELNNCIKKIANKLNIKLTEGTIYSSDVFYKKNENYEEISKEFNCIACEMESFALFHNANLLNKKAACLLTISNNFVTQKETTAEERQKSFTKMIELSLETVLSL